MNFNEEMRLLASPESLGNSIGNALKTAPKGSKLRFAVACISPSGVAAIEDSLKFFLSKESSIEAVAGIDIGAQPVKGIQSLHQICGPESVSVFWNPLGGIFHPKVYHLSYGGSTNFRCWIGSSNFSAQGLYKNHECSIEIQASTDVGQHFLSQIDEYFNWLHRNPFCLPVESALLELLKDVDTRQIGLRNRRRTSSKILQAWGQLFRAKSKTLGTAFVMILSHNDVSGKRSEPYFLIPVRARDENPRFWEWPNAFSPSARGRFPERKLRTNIWVNNGVITEERRLYWFDGKKEFRFTSPTIYKLGESFVGSLLYFSKTGTGYDINVIPSQSKNFGIFVQSAIQLSSDQKRWGYVP